MLLLAFTYTSCNFIAISNKIPPSESDPFVSLVAKLFLRLFVLDCRSDVFVVMLRYLNELSFYYIAAENAQVGNLKGSSNSHYIRATVL